VQRTISRTAGGLQLTAVDCSGVGKLRLLLGAFAGTAGFCSEKNFAV